MLVAAFTVICNGASRELLPRPRRVEAACFFGICDATPGLEQTLSNMCCKCGPYDRMSAKHTRMLCFMQFLVHTITGVALVHDFANHTETLCEALSRIRMCPGTDACSSRLPENDLYIFESFIRDSYSRELLPRSWRVEAACFLGIAILHQGLNIVCQTCVANLGHGD